MRFAKRIIEQYNYLFERSDDEGGFGEFSERVQFAKQWGWYSSVYGIAGGDLQKFRSVTKLPIHDCLTFLSFEKQKRNIENNEIQRQLKKPI